jgi:Zn-dependent protease/predicted transcriptional regulator
LYRSSIKLFTLFDIEVGINYSWFIIFGLVTLTLGTSFFPDRFPELSIWSNLFLGMMTAVLFFFSVLFHELSHSLVARQHGVPIQKISLFVFGGVAQMSKEPETPRAELLMALAGPLSSFFLALLFGGIWAIFTFLVPLRVVTVSMWYLALINVALAVFNLMPGFPLDGGRVFRAILWSFTGDLKKSTRIASSLGQVFGFALIFFGFLSLFRDNWVNGLWLIVLGWFLQQAASGSYEQLVLRESLDDVYVRDIMTTQLVTVSPFIFLDELVNDWFMRYRYGRFPVVDNERILGVITIHDVKEIPREQWSTTRVVDIVKPLDTKEVISSGEGALEALRRMSMEELSHLLVIEEQKITGIVTKSDILRIMRIRAAFGGRLRP